MTLSRHGLASGLEVDFIIGSMQVAVEAKASKKIHQDHLKGLRNLKEDFPEIAKRIVVSLEEKPRLTADGILILGAEEFVRRLWNGKIFPE